MFGMLAHPLRGQVEGGWALDVESFLGPVKLHRADRRVPFRAQKTWDFQGHPLPLAQVMDMHTFKTMDAGSKG
jgi:hypothetical protein